MLSGAGGMAVAGWIKSLNTQSSSGHTPAPRPDSSLGTAVSYLWLRLFAFFIYFFFPLELGFKCIAVAESLLLGEISPSPLAASFADL